jgi:hypothetical protein
MGGDILPKNFCFSTYHLRGAGAKCRQTLPHSVCSRTPMLPESYTYCISRRHFFSGKQLRVYEGRNRATRCAVIRGALGAPERARGLATTPPSAACSARRTPAVVSRQASTAAPEAWHRSGTTPRRGTSRWPHAGGETPQSLPIPRDVMPARLSYFRLPAMASPHLDARRKLLI